jgi:PHD/YefM family antitoxin component YafN of YafNO toxin-antitoxin module
MKSRPPIAGPGFLGGITTPPRGLCTTAPRERVPCPPRLQNLYKFWYTIDMAGHEVIQVHPLSEVRARLSGIVARFRREGAAAEPIAFGSHRKPEAILIPYEAYERYEALARQRARLDGALSAAQSVQVEVPGAFSPAHDRETVSRYRQP